MKTSILFTSACLLACTTAAYNINQKLVNGMPSLVIYENGQAKTLYLSTQAQTYNTEVAWPNNMRGTLLTSPEMSPTNFYKPKLLGGSISWSIDLSQANCGCINTMYLNSSPGKNQAGDFWDTEGQYYCDASATSGNFCPDLDLMEADMYSWQTKPHSCFEPNDKGFYSGCVQPGDCWLNTAQRGLAYGPGSDNIIDTTLPFDVLIQIGYDGTFSTELSQRGKSLQMSEQCAGNLHDPLSNGMNIVFSQWSTTTDDYLWGDKCTPGPCTQEQFTIHDITIHEGIQHEKIDEELKELYSFGDYCKGPFDGLCTGCNSCRKSWVMKQHHSEEATPIDCRCMDQFNK